MLFDIPTRSLQAEMMDLGDGSKQEFERNFKEIEAVNYWLGGLRLTKSGALTMLKSVPKGSIVDIGCGSGDVLRTMARDKRFARFELIGLDNSPQFLEIARRNSRSKRIHFNHGDILQNPEAIAPASLYMFNMMLHHFTKEQIVKVLLHFYQKSTTGLLINDLSRNYIAKGFIWMVARAFGTSRQFRNDAPLSVNKGFTRNDWSGIMQECGFQEYDIHWDPGFRHVVKIYKG